MLQVKQISKKFNEQLALKEINLSFETGSTTVIVGQESRLYYDALIC
jgi:cystine transport system ATP-binding protein